MSKTLMKTFLLILILSLTACRQSKTNTYTTTTLNCHTELVDAKSQSIDTMIKVSKKYSDSFRFAEELQDKLSDKRSIEAAQSLASQGELEEAYDALNERIIERGFNKNLSKSLDSLKAAQMIERYIYNSKSNSLSITEQAREFSRVEANSSVFFRTSPKYIKWVKVQRKLIYQKVLRDKKALHEGYTHTTDTLALSNPELLEISLLQTAIFNKLSPIPGIKTSSDPKLYNELTTSGCESFVSKSQQIIPSKEIQTPASFKESFDNIRHLAQKGKSFKSLNQLQELNHYIEVSPKRRQLIIRDLIKTNGWNDASLINGNLLDMSYLLETFYMANN